jgi:ATP-dependent DNA helicase RecG
MVAILNKHSGGELYFGVRNDGAAVGQDISDKTLRDVSQAIANHIEPQIFPDVRNVVIDNKDCILVAFEGDNVPYYAYGRAYLRVADEDKVMSPQELESCILKKNAYTNRWDSEASDKTLADVDGDVLADYINRANEVGRIEYSYTDKPDILNRLKLLKGGNITNAANVMFCHNGDLEVQMATFASNERLTFNDIKRESGTVTELVQISEKYIRDNIHWRVEFDGSLQRKEIPEVPMEAVREALVNSFCHKDYRASQNNYVSIFKNRIEIYNPGTFPVGLTPEDFIDGSEQSVQRNPLLAQILYYSKDVESFGTGLRRIMTLCKDANVKVEFKPLKMGFIVAFYRPKDEVADKVADKMADKMADKVADKPPRETAVIEYLKKNEFITSKVVCELLSVAETTAKRLLKSMIEKELLIAEGERRGRIYKLK